MQNLLKHQLPLRPLCAALALACAAGSAMAQASAPDAVLQKLEQMAQEIQKLRAEVTQLKTAQSQTQATAEQALASAAVPLAGTGIKLPGNPSTVLSGYGEINYNRYPKNPSATQADARRVVLSIQHRFDDKTKFVGEFEWEHAVTSATDQGETEVEQAYIERELSNNLSVKAGLFLMPLGLLNENHEPTAYYGVERNFVETAIIPSTWREGGVMLMGNTDSGWNWKAGVVTGFNLSKWDSQSSDGKTSPLGSVHQELQLAKAKDLGLVGALDWRGTPGLLLGTGIFSGKAGQGNAAANPRITLWDAHARWTPGKWDLAAVYAAGRVTGADALNATYAGDPTPIPAQFDGAYVQAAYGLWSQGDYALKPFVRLERFNTAKAYGSFPTGLGRAGDPYERVSTLGANLQVGQGVVLKADYQVFAVNKTNNRLNLGLGWSF